MSGSVGASLLANCGKTDCYVSSSQASFAPTVMHQVHPNFVRRNPMNLPLSGEGVSSRGADHNHPREAKPTRKAVGEKSESPLLRCLWTTLRGYCNLGSGISDSELRTSFLRKLVHKEVLVDQLS